MERDESGEKSVPRGRGYLPAVLRSHFAGVRVEDPVAAAGRLGTAPAGLAAVSRGLAVLLVRAHDPLPTVQGKRIGSRRNLRVALRVLNRGLDKRAAGRFRKTETMLTHPQVRSFIWHVDL